MKKKIAAFCNCALFLCSAGLFAEYNKFGVPDSSEIRKDLVETWFEAPLSMVRTNRPQIRANAVGQKFQIRLEETVDAFNIFVAPFSRMEVDVYSEKGKSTVLQDVFPGDGAGAWLLSRSKKTGNPSFVRYYFAADSDVYVQFVPSGKTTYADFMLRAACRRGFLSHAFTVRLSMKLCAGRATVFHGNTHRFIPTAITLPAR